MLSLQSDDVRTPPVYRARRGLKIPCEHRILSELVQSDMMVLDIGCGATGRSTRQLSVFGPHVCACDVDLRALRRFQFWLQGEERIDLVGADMLRFPFRDESFDLALVALCGLDYLWPDSRRIAALREIGRVVRPGGHFVLCSHNRLGVLTSPRGLRNWSYSRWRLRNICRLSFLHRRMTDSSGVELYQDLPRNVIRQVTDSTGLSFRYAINRSGRVKNLFLLTLFSAWPYYVFTKP